MIVKSKEGEQGGGKKDQKKKTVKIAERAEEPQVAFHSCPHVEIEINILFSPLCIFL